jgi:lysophospholipid acyltransferase (LPLAT)-like uncharacterized protein
MSRRKLWHCILAKAVNKFLALYLKTLRLQVIGKDRTQQELSTRSTGCIFLLWHDSILLSTLLEWAAAFQPINVLISNSRDGDLAAEMGSQYRNINVIRVKHNARATAVVESCKLLEERQAIFITPDGPRGPRHRIKPGALYACQKAGACLIPVVYAASSVKTLSSWDRFRIPLPFSRVIFSYLEPICCPREGDLEEVRREIETKMETEEMRLKNMLERH